MLVVFRQVAYIQSRDLGYDREHVVHFNIPIAQDSLRQSAAATFVRQLRNIPGIVNASSYGQYQHLYASEIRVGILSRYFAGLAAEHRRSCFATLLPRS